MSSIVKATQRRAARGNKASRQKPKPESASDVRVRITTTIDESLLSSTCRKERDACLTSYSKASSAKSDESRFSHLSAVAMVAWILKTRDYIKGVDIGRLAASAVENLRLSRIRMMLESNPNSDASITSRVLGLTSVYLRCHSLNVNVPIKPIGCFRHPSILRMLATKRVASLKDARLRDVMGAMRDCQTPAELRRLSIRRFKPYDALRGSSSKSTTVAKAKLTPVDLAVLVFALSDSDARLYTDKIIELKATAVDNERAALIKTLVNQIGGIDELKTLVKKQASLKAKRRPSKKGKK